MSKKAQGRAKRIANAVNLVATAAILDAVANGESFPVPGTCQCSRCERYYPKYYVTHRPRSIICFDCQLESQPLWLLNGVAALLGEA